MAEENTVVVTTPEPTKGEDFLKQAFSHPVIKEQRDDMLRYKEELKAARSRLDEIEAAKAKEEAERLEKQGEWQKRFEAEKARADGLTEAIKREKITSAIRAEAAAQGAVNPGDANFSSLSVTVNEAGEVEGVKEAVGAVLEKLPYLKAHASPSTFDSRPAGPKGTKTFLDLLNNTQEMARMKKEEPETFKRLRAEHYKGR
jgi:hypothetical protein